MLNQKNSRKQGDVGLGTAIAYFCLIGWTVCVPLTDNQEYDLVIDNDGLKKVQVKTTKYKHRGSYQASLKVCGGNRSGQTIKNFDNNVVDYVFVLTDSNDKYLIPAEEIKSKTSLTLNKSYNKFKL